MHRAMVAWWDTAAILGIPVVPLVENDAAMFSFEDFASDKCSHGLSPSWSSVSQDWKPDAIEGLWTVLKTKMLLLGIGTERVLFARVMVGSCWGEVMIHRTDETEKIRDSSEAVLLGFEPINDAPVPTIPRKIMGYMIYLVEL